MNKTNVAQQPKTASFLPPVQSMLQRKCACGNHTVAGGECAECAKKTVLQRKLTIGASNDPLEFEADRIAEQVMAASAHSTTSRAPVRIQRYAGQATEDLEAAPASVDHVLTGSGRPIDESVRNDMEPLFSHDFSQVKVHQGASAEQSAAQINANAYTVGNNIVFGAGKYAPQTQDGKRLLAHELAHVVQQNQTVRPYRNKKAFNFGKADDATLIEDSFNIRKDKETKPWIKQVNVVFSTKKLDADGNNFWTGKADALYYDNPVKLPDFSFSITGGSAELGKSDKGSFVVHRIEGIGYNSGSNSGRAGVDYDPANREGPNKRYSKDLSANMSFAVFYNKGEALHAGPIDASSHGCVHVDWTTDTDIKKLNYHSVIGLTKVSVSYP